MSTALEVLPQRIISKIDFEGSGGCWLWVAAKNHLGYASVYWKGATAVAHRLIYRELAGEIPAGLVLDHLCRVRHCVNPDHLEPVTQQENVVRGASANKTKTHCPQGHEYTKENTWVSKTGSRFCRACSRLSQLRLRALRRAKR